MYILVKTLQILTTHEKKFEILLYNWNMLKGVWLRYFKNLKFLVLFRKRVNLPIYLLSMLL